MRKYKKRRRGRRRALISALISALTILMTGLLLTGCDGEIPAADPGNGRYDIYLSTPAGTGLVRESYETKTTDPDALVEELMGQLRTSPADGDRQSIFPESVELRKLSLQEDVLTIDFSKEYLKMDKNREVLCRAALAKTLGQVEAVHYISLTCDGQPLTDSGGKPIGAFNGNDFVSSITDVNAFEKVHLVLYFANADGTALVKEEREVVHNVVKTSRERLVMDQLLAGPTEEGHQPILPKDVKILGVTVTDGICYVNLDSAFAQADLPVADQVVIYGLVNSMTELTSVSKLQLLVNGSADSTFRTVKLNLPFERNETYISAETEQGEAQ